ncbi:MAG: hypothetical protein RPR40_10100 [Bermanella sp.]|jgi:hypothetical protein
MKANIGAGKIILAREGNIADTFEDVGELYDPIPEIDLQRDALDDTNTASDFERTKAGMKKIGALTFKIKTSATGGANAKADWISGEERRWKFTIPSDEVSDGGIEAHTLKAWVSNYKLTPSMKDETFILLTLNINELEGL